MICPTPLDKLCDAQGRPHFLWDNDLTLGELRALLASADEIERGYWIGVTMRQARPDDALSLVDDAEIRRLWRHVEPFLGKSRAFWTWYLSAKA